MIKYKQFNVINVSFIQLLYSNFNLVSLYSISRFLGCLLRQMSVRQNALVCVANEIITQLVVNYQDNIQGIHLTIRRAFY